MNPQILPKTLDWYRERGKTDPDIAVLVAMIEKLQGQLTRSLEIQIAQKRLGE